MEEFHADQKPADPCGLISIRHIRQSDRPAIAELIRISTNYWYETNGKPRIFTGPPCATELFFDVYEALDPGCTFVAENTKTGFIAGACFYHPRPTHVSLGIMNVHPNYFGIGVARMLLQSIIDVANNESKPVRLVSSAQNLDSFSLYTRAGFVPRMAFQDLLMTVPEHGLRHTHPMLSQVRPATPTDVTWIADLEEQLSGIRRESDIDYFVRNTDQIWNTVVVEDECGLAGYLASIAHPGSNMIGPGIARTEQQAAALILAQLNWNRGRTPVWLVPVQSSGLVGQMYAWGARNCEIHFAQVLGDWTEPTGIVMPTFMPESG